jgi:hypothetical protein
MGADLTRRGLIRSAAAGAGALAGGSLLAPRTVFAGESGEAVFRVNVQGSGRVIATKRPFDLIGIDGVPGSGAQVRARGEDGRWTDWLEVTAARGHGPDDAAPSTLSDPVWTGPADAFEVRSKRPLHGARAVLVHSGGTAHAAAAKHYVASNLPAGPGQPAIIARSSWASAACKPRVPAVFGAVQLAFVHHTVSSNAYSASQSAAMVRSICLFHKYGNGWNDIGYNFVVDRYGQIFEARAGGSDEAIVGAQAGGYNVYSTGVALLGTFSGGGPNRQTFNALSHLLAWKLSVHGIELPGTVTVQVTSQGAPYSRYRAGSRVRLNRIAGHRDGDTTSCPGTGMYRQLPRLRQVVRGLAGTVGALSLQGQAAQPGSVTVGGSLSAGGVAIGGATIEVQRRSTTKGDATLATATTNADGSWSVALPLASNASLRAVFRGDTGHPAVVSTGIFAAVPPQLTLTAATQVTTPGGVIDFSGSVAPAKKQVSIVISQQQPDGSLTTIRTIRLNAASDGTFARSIGFANAGQYQVIAHTAADDTNALGSSAPVAITVA